MPVQPRPAYTKNYSFTTPNAPIKVFFLQASRSIHAVWLLEKLSTLYSLDTNERIDYVKLALQEFKDRCGSPMGKFPVEYDEGEQLLGSGMIFSIYVTSMMRRKGGRCP